MSGVIDENGTQWEHCNLCGEFVKLPELGYEKPTKRWPYGRMVCIQCVPRLSQWAIRRMVPGEGWVPVYE